VREVASGRKDVPRTKHECYYIRADSSIKDESDCDFRLDVAILIWRKRDRVELR